MYKKVLYNIKKMKKCGVWGGGGGNIWTQNTLYVFKKRKIKKKSKKKIKKIFFDRAGIWTHDLRVRNPLG